MSNFAGEKPYSCEICGKKFRVRSDMKRHMKTHNRKRLIPRKLQSTENQLIKFEATENMLEHSDESTETKIKTNENDIVQSLQYDQDPLATDRDGNTLYVMPVLIN